MRKEFLLNSGLLLALNVLIKPLYVLGIEREVQNVVGASSYGLYFTLIGFIYLFQFVNDFGFAQYLRKYISESRLEIPHSFSSIIALKLILSALFVVLIIGLNYIFDYEKQEILLLVLISCSFVISSLIQVYRAGLTGLGYYTSDSFLSIIDKLLLVIFCSVFIFTSYRSFFDIYIFVYCQLLSLLLALLIAIVMFHTRIKVKWLRFDAGLTKQFIVKAAPFALIILLMSSYSRLDGIMIRELLDDGLYQAGSYAAGYRLFEAANMFVFMIAALLLPMASYLISIKESLDELINLSLRLIVIMTFSSVIVTSFYSNEIMQLLYLEYQIEWGGILFWLMLGFIPLGLGHIFGVFMMANDQVKSLNKVYLLALILNFVLNIVLIPKMQAVGAAVATLITQLWVILFQVILFSRAYTWKMHQPIQFIGFILGSIIAGYFIWMYSPFSWMINIMGTGVAILVFGMLCNMLPLKELRQYIARRRTIS